MGTRTFVTPITPIKRPRPLYIGWDIPLLLVVLSLIVIGLLMVYSASWKYSLENAGSVHYVLNRQITWALTGLIAAAVISLIDYRRLHKWVLPVMAVTVGMLLLVLLVEDDSMAPRRTLFSGSVQPSELAKLAIIIYLSAWLYAKRDQINNISLGLLPMMVILGTTSGLILLQPDISAAATIVMLGGILFFLANGELRQIILVLVAASLVGWLVVTVSDTGRERFLDYVNGFSDPQSASYHVQRAMEAVVRGGVFGVGIGRGTTKFTGLPVPWTDSIFAVIAEEIGLIGSAVVISLYIILLWRGLSIAHRAPDMFGRLLAGGLTIWIALEAFINIGVMVNLIPFAGNALPLMSAGGSSMVMTLVAIGLLMNISRSAVAEHEKKQGSIFNAVADLRRRDGRRGISRGSRPASPRR
ncbi:MAG TPA: FtsW/RodA/SpoVE family cell cycle protein [Levilinea sp.]|nr:FtsW/RodA/SpoVE family cell cycle protein [Levilinea sp.]